MPTKGIPIAEPKGKSGVLTVGTGAAASRDFVDESGRPTIPDPRARFEYFSTAG